MTPTAAMSLMTRAFFWSFSHKPRLPLTLPLLLRSLLMVVLKLVSLGLMEKVVELGGMLLALGAGPAGMLGICEVRVQVMVRNGTQRGART